MEMEEIIDKRRRKIATISGIVTIFSLLLVGVHWGFAVIGIGALLITLIALFVHRIPWGEAWVIDRGVGKKKGLREMRGPGYAWIFPILGMDRIRKKVKTMSYPIQLFPENPRIPLKSGGEVILNEPLIWITVKDAKKAIEKVEDFEKKIKEVAETRLGGALNKKRPEEILEIRMGEDKGKRIAKEIFEEEGSGWWRLFQEGDEEYLGVSYDGFTLSDIDLSEEITRKREEKEIWITYGKDIAAMQGEATQKEISTAIGKLTEEFKKLGYSEEEARHQAYITWRQMLTAEKGELIEIVGIEKGGSLAQIGAQLGIGQRIIQERRTKNKRKPPGKSGETKSEEEVVDDIISGRWGERELK